MLEVGKTYRYKDDLGKDDVYILSRLDDQGEYYCYAVYFVDRKTKATEVGEMEIRRDALENLTEVKE